MMRVYIVYLDGIEVGRIRAKGHNAAERAASVRWGVDANRISVAYTEI
jgi:hypothetical protein